VSQEILSRIADRDYARISEGIEGFIRSRVAQAGKDGVILGLSGGVDSAVTAVLAKRCFPESTLAMVMPDSKVSPREETADALRLADGLGLDYKLLDINLIVSEFAKVLEPSRRGTGNLRARVRADILYYYANVRNYLVLGSSDKSEFLIGYFTKHGDGAADAMPIASLYKTQVRRLAGHLGVPQEIIGKKSSPNLWPDHDAEAEIGLTYEEIDPILHCLVDRGLSSEETERELGASEEKILRVCRMHRDSMHKREPAPRAPEM